MTTASPYHTIIRALHSASEPLLTLNNDHAIELSPLSLTELDLLIRESFYAATINCSGALIIAFDQSSRYDHVNFLWFRDRYDKFIYVDRVVTSSAARGKGYARALYTELFQRAKSAGHHRITCEVISILQIPFPTPSTTASSSPKSAAPPSTTEQKPYVTCSIPCESRAPSFHRPGAMNRSNFQFCCVLTPVRLSQNERLSTNKTFSRLVKPMWSPPSSRHEQKRCSTIVLGPDTNAHTSTETFC